MAPPSECVLQACLAAAFSVCHLLWSFLSELRTFWEDPKVGLHFPQGPVGHGEGNGPGCMPPVDSTVASLIATPEKALRLETCCPSGPYMFH